jgi:hypothetical protein
VVAPLIQVTGEPAARKIKILAENSKFPGSAMATSLGVAPHPMTIAARTIVSISDNTDIRQGWRVRVFVLPADWNALGRTIAERRFRSEAAARRWASWATKMVAELHPDLPPAEIQG